MTKEELKQEAEEYVSSVASGTAEEMELYARFYIASAEPREKRIAELEHQLTHRNCLDCSNHSSKLRMKTLELEQKLKQTEKDLADYQFNYPTIKELQKEIAELKKKNLDTQDAVTMQMYTNKANKEIADKQLTKAKELLKRWINSYGYVDVALCNQTDQFISEVGK